MFSNYLSSINGIELYPIISLIIFFTVFCGLLIWTFKADKTYLNKMRYLPLDKSDENKINPENKNGNK